MLTIDNNHQEIANTNFWQTELAQLGYFFLSGNAGAWRLLVPAGHEAALNEMATAKHVEIELDQCAGQDVLHIWFEDGTDTPFRLLIDQRQCDRTVLPTKSRSPLLIYTEEGLVQNHRVRKIIRRRNDSNRRAGPANIFDCGTVVVL